MAFRNHEDHDGVQELTQGRKVIGCFIFDDHVILTFDNQDWLEIKCNDNPFSTELTAIFTEWVEDEEGG